MFSLRFLLKYPSVESWCGSGINSDILWLVVEWPHPGQLWAWGSESQVAWWTMSTVTPPRLPHDGAWGEPSGTWSLVDKLKNQGSPPSVAKGGQAGLWVPSAVQSDRRGLGWSINTRNFRILYFKIAPSVLELALQFSTPVTPPQQPSSFMSSDLAQICPRVQSFFVQCLFLLLTASFFQFLPFWSVSFEFPFVKFYKW